MFSVVSKKSLWKLGIFVVPVKQCSRPLVTSGWRVWKNFKISRLSRTARLARIWWKYWIAVEKFGEKLNIKQQQILITQLVGEAYKKTRGPDYEENAKMFWSHWMFDNSWWIWWRFDQTRKFAGVGCYSTFSSGISTTMVDYRCHVKFKFILNKNILLS